MFKWVKRRVAKTVKKYLDENLDRLADTAVEKIDIPEMSERQEKEHMNRLKNFGKELAYDLLDIWANK